MSRQAALTLVSDASENVVVRPAGDSVYAELGYADAADMEVKSRLVLSISKRMEKLGLPQARAAERFGLSQPDVSKLLRGRHRGYSVERLCHFLNLLGSDVEITVSTPKAERAGHTRVRALEMA